MVTKNLMWQRISNHPFIKAKPGTIASEAITTPDVLEVNGNLFFYLGAVNNSQEKIILTIISKKEFTNSKNLLITNEAKNILQPGPYVFDCEHVFDPAVINWKEKYWLYYSAIGIGQDKVGLAISEDGTNFEKFSQPILTGRSPEVIIKGNKVYLFYVKELPNQGYSIFLKISGDGYNFSCLENNPVLPIGNPNDWDSFEVTTPRIFEFGNTYYMIYAGLNYDNQKDIPRKFGLARSDDLIHWEKYPHNPVFESGEEGTWDDGAIWFGTPFILNKNVFLVYEGGRLRNILNKTPALTEVGLAKLPLEYFKEEVSNW